MKTFLRLMLALRDLRILLVDPDHDHSNVLLTVEEQQLLVWLTEWLQEPEQVRKVLADCQAVYLRDEPLDPKRYWQLCVEMTLDEVPRFWPE